MARNYRYCGDINARTVCYVSTTLSEWCSYYIHANMHFLPGCVFRFRWETHVSQNITVSSIRTSTLWRNKSIFKQLGEKMLHRRIVAITPVRCFLIPRYWLFEHNRANIWGRVKLFMDSKYPTKRQLFNEFLLNRKYDKLLISNVVLVPFSDSWECNDNYQLTIYKNSCTIPSGFHFRWMTYKQNLVKDVIQRRGHFRSNTTIHDVPYSIRITDEIDSKL